MVDLSEFVGDDPLRASTMKKLAKEQERLEKLEAKTNPIRANILMYKEIIAAIDRRKAAGLPTITDGDDDQEETDEVETVNPRTGMPTATTYTRQARENPHADEEAALMADLTAHAAKQPQQPADEGSQLETDDQTGETYDRAPLPAFLRNAAAG